MNAQDAIDILDNAILGKPNTCLSEHARKLAQVRDFLASSPPVVADAPRATTPPELKSYWIRVTLEDNYLAASEEEAWEKAMQHISTRQGMQLVSHDMGEVT